MLLCGACAKREAQIYVKRLPALCVSCAKAVRIPLRSGLHLDYLTADGFASAKLYVQENVQENVKPKVTRAKRTHVPSTFLFNR